LERSLGLWSLVVPLGLLALIIGVDLARPLQVLLWDAAGEQRG
jgi:hypothetical protein